MMKSSCFSSSSPLSIRLSWKTSWNSKSHKIFFQTTQKKHSLFCGNIVKWLSKVKSCRKITNRSERKGNQMMYNALDIAAYIVEHENTCGRVVSNLRLQKQLYFVQASFYQRYGEPCFKDQIEAWDFGPVVPTVYKVYKYFGSFHIPYAAKSSSMIIQERDQAYIGSLLDSLSKFSTSTLVDISHAQKPWQLAYTGGHGRVISSESMYRYFYKG